MMLPNPDSNDLKERLDLIESMIAEGRRSTERWGWVFVLWGVAYYAAFAWSDLGQSSVAWPVTMIAAGIISTLMGGRRARNHPRTEIGRAIASVWLAMGISLFVIMISLGFSGRLDSHLSLAIVGSMLAVANGASGVILRWRLQIVCAVAWLGAAEVACFGTASQGIIAFLAATFLCQIVFGIYSMICESRRRNIPGAAHA